jgi:tetratricopeptide (TPR) repeat protein
MSTLSAVLIVKNEEANLGSCLSALDGVVDEIVVVDTGSQDGTVEVAREFTPNCHCFEWVDDFAAARNAALAYATGDYVLSIDADETLENTTEARALLDTFMKEQDDDVVGMIEIVSIMGSGRDARETIDQTERFFLRSAFRFEGAIHEQITPLEGAKRSASTGLRLRHSGYDQEADAPDHKAHRNIGILKRAIEEHPDDEYYLHQLGKAHFSLKEYPAAIDAFEQALAAIHFERGVAPAGRKGLVARPVLTDLVTTLAYAYVNSEQSEKARDMVERHLELGHPGVQRADFHYVRGYVYLMLGDIPRAREATEQSMQWGPSGEDVRGTGSFTSAYQLGLLCEAESDLANALGHYHNSLQMWPEYGVTLSRCVDIITEQKVALPPEIWDVCDHQTMTEVYLEHVEAALVRGDMDSATVLVQAFAGMGPEMLAQCRAYLQEFLERGESDAT